MTFTDDDLICLETYMDNYAKPDMNEHFKALLARLESSEAYARYGDLLHGGKSAECVLGKCDMCKAKEAWRKECGK
jgi:hypothetical protein